MATKSIENIIRKLYGKSQYVKGLLEAGERDKALRATKETTELWSRLYHLIARGRG